MHEVRNGRKLIFKGLSLWNGELINFFGSLRKRWKNHKLIPENAGKVFFCIQENLFLIYTFAGKVFFCIQGNLFLIYTFIVIFIFIFVIYFFPFFGQKKKQNEIFTFNSLHNQIFVIQPLYWMFSIFKIKLHL